MDGKRYLLRTSAGSVVIVLAGNRPHVGVTRFAGLADAGAFDGTVFHRFVRGFVLQGGCPQGTGASSMLAGFTAPLPAAGTLYRRGTVALATSAPVGGHGSQFFVCLADQPSLTADYPLLGHLEDADELYAALDQWKSTANEAPTPAIRLVSLRPAAARVRA